MQPVEIIQPRLSTPDTHCQDLLAWKRIRVLSVSVGSLLSLFCTSEAVEQNTYAETKSLSNTLPLEKYKGGRDLWKQNL